MVQCTQPKMTLITVLFSESKTSSKTSLAQSPSYWFESIWNTALYN